MLNNVCHHDKYIMSNMTDKMKNRNRKQKYFNSYIQKAIEITHQKTSYKTDKKEHL